MSSDRPQPEPGPTAARTPARSDVDGSGSSSISPIRRVRTARRQRFTKGLLLLTVACTVFWCVAGARIRFVYYQYLVTTKRDLSASRRLLTDFPGGEGREFLLSLFQESADPGIRSAVVAAWSQEHDLVAMYNLSVATQDPDPGVRQLAAGALELRVVDAHELAKSLVGAIIGAKNTPDVERRLAGGLEALSYGSFVCPTEESGEDLGEASRSWLAGNLSYFDAVTRQ